jgi:hypothetical protein
MNSTKMYMIHIEKKNRFCCSAIDADCFILFNFFDLCYTGARRTFATASQQSSTTSSQQQSRKYWRTCLDPPMRNASPAQLAASVAPKTYEVQPITQQTWMIWAAIIAIGM